MFLPATLEEARALGWDKLDVVLVTGDAYIDSSYIGVSVIGHVLADKGWRVGIVSQPESERDVARLGEPSLFWGVTSGCMDSMISNRTASGRRRREDDLTAGGRNTRRPDRALIAYTNLIRRRFKRTAPIVLGGLEASLRRVAHYDYWSDSIRRSVLFDAKADYLLYGMAENAAAELASRLKAGKDLSGIRGLCRAAAEPPPGFLELPSFEEAAKDKRAFERMFRTFYDNNDPASAKGLAQRHGSRFLIHNPPASPLTSAELDRVYGLPYEREVHPSSRKSGSVRAIETFRFSITTHRGCYGECNFCSIAPHQGRRVVSRSEASILQEARDMTRHPAFKGIISDVGGPTANMYGTGCSRKGAMCRDKRCVFPLRCKALKTDHTRLTDLLKRLRALPGVRRVFVASGIRFDLVVDAGESGKRYLGQLAAHHVSGQLKLAPEHTRSEVLRLMGKPAGHHLKRFRGMFEASSRKAGKRQFLTYYFIAAHPGCTRDDMAALRRFAERDLRLRPEQVQIFTPSPSTYSTLMYHTGRDPFSGEGLFVEKGEAARERQKRSVVRSGKGKKRRRGPWSS